MPNPQNPELRRSEEVLRPRPELGEDRHRQALRADQGEPGGPVPPGNQPGHHPDHDQDKPPLDDFAQAMGIRSDRDDEAEAEPPEPPAGEGEVAEPPASEAETEPAEPPTGEAAAEPTEPAAGETETEPAEPPAGEAETEPAPATASEATASEAAEEAMGEAARRHDHALPDDELPHEPGLVTPNGTPITARVLTVPLRCAGSAVRAGWGLTVVGGRLLRRVGTLIAEGPHRR
jgi:hypothetical protein